jgi:hypothetical protein
MVATPITPSTRYIPPGVRHYYWVPTIATKASPTRSELNAGTDLTGEIQAVAGFSVESVQVDTPDLLNTFIAKIPGRTQAADSSITMYASSNSVDARTLLVRGTAGFIVSFPEGDIGGQKMDVFPVKVSAAPKDTATEDPGKIMFTFSITSQPVENVTIP